MPVMMQAMMTPRTPLDGTSYFQQSRDNARFLEATARPMSTATEIIDTDGEDEASDFEEYSLKPSFESDSRRRSQTTISSFDEVPTPSSSRNSGGGLAAPHVMVKPVEGPSGPHLFRASQISADFNFDHALQMSPLQSKPMDFRSTTAFTEQTLIQLPLDQDDESVIQHWSTEDVVDWMVAIGMDASVIESFEMHDVDGTVLLDLEFEDLRDLDITSFGKRHQVWNAIADLRGLERIPSPSQTPFQDTSRPCTTRPSRSTSRRNPSRRNSEDDMEPTTPGGKKRRARKPSRDIITPAESVSIVAIEQLLPKPHVCSKGERCAKWRKQQRELAQLQSENGIGRFPISPTKGGRIHVTGDPGNAATAENMIPNARLQIDTSRRDAEAARPLESAGFPSVVASSGILSPQQLPPIALHEGTLSQVAHRCPQENVKQFLSFQHLNSPVIPVDDAPPSPPPEAAPRRASDPIRRSGSVPPLFPEQYHQAYPSLSQQAPSSLPHQGLKQLPRLDIPRSSSAAPDLNVITAIPLTAIPDSACRTAIPSPTHVYRLGTPASEMDVPCMDSVEPLSRDASQSVPPNMQYRQNAPKRSASRAGAASRRPSMLPAVKENEIFSPARENAPRPSMSSNNSSTFTEKFRDPAHHSPQTIQFGYGESCSHSGWMKKRKTKLLRHEWRDAHFRLQGNQLNMHANARLSADTLSSINVDDYAVACSNVASSSKLTAAMKAFNIKNDKTKETDATAFAFQLVPTRDGSLEDQRKRLIKDKTHHFAVNTKDDRIDWMREIMLVKALQQKGKGYEVEINGHAA